MKKHDESIPLAPSMSPIMGKKSVQTPGGVDKRVLYLSIQAIFNALVIGLIAKGLVYLIDLITNISFYGKFTFEPMSPANNNLGLTVIAIPIIGSLIVGVIARYGSKAVRGHGIPEAMEKIILDDSKIPPLITLLKPLSAAISIGTGGPFGAEGPIIATGGAFGSFTGQIMHITATERKIMLSAGACAGMAAIFGSPLAAVLLAIELLLFEFSARSIIPVALACITGAGMHIWLFGHDPVFAMGAIPAPSDSALLVYVGMGLLIGVIAALVSKSVYAVEDLFEKLPIHWMWWPALGAIAVGVVGYFAPFTMGVGYDNIQHLLEGNLPLAALLSLCLLKYISWVISLGSGTSGGTLAPLFTIGGAAGALIGLVILHVFPGSGITLATAALVGMAAMFAGASRALLTSIVFALETTGQPNGLLPLLGACIAAYFVSFFLMKGSIMTEKIRRRGVSTPDTYESDLLRHTTAKEIMTPVAEQTTALHAVRENDDLGACMQLMGEYGVSELLVTDDAGHVKGMLNATSLIKYYSDQRAIAERYEAPVRTKRFIIRTRRLMHAKR
ncbi:chloride channel protein [Chitinophaga agrisoli]|nr:chloride channel protein [Chitinophaga agrisoli]